MPILNWPLQSESHRQPRQPETVEDCNDHQMPYTTSGPFRTQTSLDVRCFGRALNPTRRVSERKTRSNKVRSLLPHEKMAQPRSPKYPGSLLRGKTFRRRTAPLADGAIVFDSSPPSRTGSPPIRTQIIPVSSSVGTRSYLGNVPAADFPCAAVALR